METEKRNVYVSLRKLAFELNVSEALIRQRIENDHFPRPTMIDGVLYVRRDKVDRYLAKRAEQGRPFKKNDWGTQEIVLDDLPTSA